MKGSYFIEINTKKINYKFTINRNITIIRGDSATGKTTLSDLIKEYKNSDYISLISKVNCEYLDDRDWLYRINEYKNTIFFVDEESDFILTKEFAREISKGNDNYFVIITRDNLPYLNYSYKEIYEIHNSGKYNYLVRKYDFEDDIVNLSKLKFIDIESIITEDSKSGYELIKELYKTSKVITLEGKSKIYKYIKNKHKIILFVDGAAFGNEIDRLMLVFENDNILYIPESIEYIILNSCIFDNKVNNIINNLNDYVDSKLFSSYEKFLIKLLKDNLNKMKYSSNYKKGSIDNFLVSNYVLKNIMNNLPECIRPNNMDYNEDILDWC